MEEPTGMFSGLTSTAIMAEATTFAANFDGVVKVIVGVGLGFACVAFVKRLFF